MLPTTKHRKPSRRFARPREGDAHKINCSPSKVQASRRLAHLREGVIPLRLPVVYRAVLAQVARDQHQIENVYRTISVKVGA
jgi:hypothetical protein